MLGADSIGGSERFVYRESGSRNEDILTTRGHCGNAEVEGVGTSTTEDHILHIQIVILVGSIKHF